MKKNEKYEIAKNQYLEDKTKSLSSICKENKIDRVKFSKYLKEQGIEVKRRKKTSEDYIEAIKMYKETNLSLNEVGKKFNIHGSTLSKLIEEYEDNNILSIKNKYCVNSNYFSIIDSEEKAYWLGFLYADGYNSNKYIQLQIADYDYNHLKKFRKAISSNHPIKYINNCSRIIISDKQLCSDLNSLGCIKNKTYSCTFPSYKTIDYKYLRDFIRGFFDGDGTIKKMNIKEITSANTIKRNIHRISFTIKHKPFAERLIEAIKIVTGIEASFYYYEPHDKYEVYISGQEKISFFLNSIYKEASIFLDRKFKQYLEYILPSCLEIDKIISTKLSGESLPDYEYDQRPIRTEGVEKLDYGNIIDSRDASQGQSIEDEA